MNNIDKNDELLKQKAAHIASSSKSLFLEKMAHERRTPLNVIVGFSELMTKQVYGNIQPAKYLEYADAIHTSSLHLLELINDMLDLSKIEAGQMVLHEQNVDLARLLKSVNKILANKFEEKSILLKMDGKHTLLYVDEKIFKQIFLNLLSNSIKYTQQNGQVVINSFEDESGLHIHIEDNGIGMSDDEIELALKPFGQAVNGENMQERGSGLGLPLVHTMVVLHGGELLIESQKGIGTTMKILLPHTRVIAN
jgi:signal transduction histidine kinase